MLVSTRRGIQYPNPNRSDVPDIPAHFVNLVNALDLDTPFYTGTFAAMPTAASRVQGSWYYATDTSTLYFDNGVSWVALAGLNNVGLTGTPTAPTPVATDNSTAIATTAFVRTILPPGVMVPYLGAAAPTGWLLCDGSAVSRTTYAALYAILSTVYGTGDGSTTFNLPDLRGRTPVGKNTATFATLGAKGGEESHVLSVAEMPSHQHTGTTGGRSAAHSHTGVTGTENQSHTHSQFVHYRSDVLINAGGSIVINDVNQITGASIGTNTSGSTGSTESAAHNHNFTTNPETTDHTHSFTSDPTGSGSPHNNLTPYIVTNYIVKI